MEAATEMDQNREKWTDREVEGLLCLYAAEDTTEHKRNRKIFTTISEQLAATGVHHTPKQCREKIKKLKQDYKKIKDFNNQGGVKRKRGKWFEALDAILGHRAPYAARAVDAAAQPDEGAVAGSSDSDRLSEICADESASETSFVEIRPEVSSVPSCYSPTPPPARPGKRRRTEADVLTVVREMLEQEKEERRHSRALIQSLVDLLKEQALREAEEVAQARSQQAAFMEGLLTTINRLVEGTQGLRHPDVD